MSPERIAANERAFGEILGQDREAIEANGLDVEKLARDVARSMTGIALWPTIVFEQDRSVVYETRGPLGEMRLSHWPTVLPPLRERPLLVSPGTTVTADWCADPGTTQPSTPLEYSLVCDTAPPVDAASAEAAAQAAAQRLSEESRGRGRRRGARERERGGGPRGPQEGARRGLKSGLGSPRQAGVGRVHAGGGVRAHRGRARGLRRVGVGLGRRRGVGEDVLLQLEDGRVELGVATRVSL